MNYQLITVCIGKPLTALYQHFQHLKLRQTANEEEMRVIYFDLDFESTLIGFGKEPVAPSLDREGALLRLQKVYESSVNIASGQNFLHINVVLATGDQEAEPLTEMFLSLVDELRLMSNAQIKILTIGIAANLTQGLLAHNYLSARSREIQAKNLASLLRTVEKKEHSLLILENKNSSGLSLQFEISHLSRILFEWANTLRTNYRQFKLVYEKIGVYSLGMASVYFDPVELRLQLTCMALRQLYASAGVEKQQENSPKLSPTPVLLPLHAEAFKKDYHDSLTNINRKEVESASEEEQHALAFCKSKMQRIMSSIQDAPLSIPEKRQLLLAYKAKVQELLLPIPPKASLPFSLTSLVQVPKLSVPYAADVSHALGIHLNGIRSSQAMPPPQTSASPVSESQKVKAQLEAVKVELENTEKRYTRAASLHRLYITSAALIALTGVALLLLLVSILPGSITLLSSLIPLLFLAQKGKLHSEITEQKVSMKTLEEQLKTTTEKQEQKDFIRRMTSKLNKTWTASLAQLQDLFERQLTFFKQMEQAYIHFQPLAPSCAEEVVGPFLSVISCANREALYQELVAPHMDGKRPEDFFQKEALEDGSIAKPFEQLREQVERQVAALIAEPCEDFHLGLFLNAKTASPHFGNPFSIAHYMHHLERYSAPFIFLKDLHLGAHESPEHFIFYPQQDLECASLISEFQKHFRLKPLFQECSGAKQQLLSFQIKEITDSASIIALHPSVLTKVRD
ncbi:MAG: hypothetical protein ACXIT9_00130 [Nitritalea sp.]